MRYRIAFPMVALAMVSGCNGRDATDSVSPDAHPAIRLSASQSSAESPVIEVTYTKWITTYPAMAGFTSYGSGTFAGTILERTAFANGIIIQLKALYVITDPTGGGRSFTALIQGTENLETQAAVLNGVITEGWMIGSHVHVAFQVIAPCPQFGKNVCFQGTIRILPG